MFSAVSLCRFPILDFIDDAHLKVVAMMCITINVEDGDAVNMVKQFC